MTISGVNKAKRGNIVFNGENIENKQPHKIVDMGICQVPEGRRIFSRLTVEENLRLGAHANEKGKYFENDIKEVYDLFPVLSDRKTQRGGTLSGGEQQMLAIGRALMSKPKVLLLDEPFAGVDLLSIQDIKGLLLKLQTRGCAVLVTDHNASQLLSVVDRAYVLANGTIVANGLPRQIVNTTEAQKLYFGSDFKF